MCVPRFGMVLWILSFGMFWCDITASRRWVWLVWAGPGPHQQVHSDQSHLVLILPKEIKTWKEEIRTDM